MVEVMEKEFQEEDGFYGDQREWINKEVRDFNK